MNIKQIIKKTYKYYQYMMSKRYHLKTIDSMREGCNIKSLSADQIREIKQFYKANFNEDVNLKWHEYYYSINGIFSPEYIPTYLYYNKICPKINPPKKVVMYSDKNMIDKVLPAAKTAETYVKNINGFFYIDGKPATLADAIKACSNLSDAIIKHSTETSQGKSVARFSAENGQAFVKNDSTTLSVEELLSSYDKDYIVQSAIAQCDAMASLNPTSLNTIRIMTYKRKSDVVILYSVVRMGRKGAVVDNASAGGLYCGVQPDGHLKKEAYALTPFFKSEVSDNGVVFADFVIPRYEDMKSIVKEWHNELPYAGFIGWDLAVDNNNDIVLVEINAASPGLFQVATGPAFGEYTMDIIKKCRS